MFYIIILTIQTKLFLDLHFSKKFFSVWDQNIYAFLDLLNTPHNHRVSTEKQVLYRIDFRASFSMRHHRARTIDVAIKGPPLRARRVQPELHPFRKWLSNVEGICRRWWSTTQHGSLQYILYDVRRPESLIFRSPPLPSDPFPAVSRSSFPIRHRRLHTRLCPLNGGVERLRIDRQYMEKGLQQITFLEICINNKSFSFFNSTKPYRKSSFQVCNNRFLFFIISY